MQFLKSGKDFFRIHQRVGAVQQQNVEVIGAQSFQAVFRRPDDMFPRKIVHARPNAAFGLENEFFARNFQIAHDLSEFAFAFAARVNIRVVKHIHPRVQRGGNERLRLFDGFIPDPHAAEDDPRALRPPFSEFSVFHDRFSPLACPKFQIDKRSLGFVNL